MSLKVAVSFDPKPLIDGLTFLDDKVKGKANYKALKQTLNTVKKETIRLVRGEYAYKTAALRDRIEIKLIGEGITAAGKLESSMRPRGLATFLKGTPLIHSRISKKPVKYLFKKSEGTKVISHGAFLAKGKNDNWQVFRVEKGVTSNGKPVLKAMNVYSVATTIDYTPRINKLAELAGKEYQNNFIKDCEFYFQKEAYR